MFSSHLLEANAREDKLGVAAVTMRPWADIWSGGAIEAMTFRDAGLQIRNAPGANKVLARSRWGMLMHQVIVLS